MTTRNKIIGTLSIASSVIVFYVGYYAATGVATIGSWAADKIGATGAAHTGVTLLVFVPLLGLVGATTVMMCLLIVAGVRLIRK